MDVIGPKAAPQDEPGRPGFAAIVRDLLTRPDATIRLDDVLAAFGERAFGAVILLFAAPNLLPLPPGSSSVLAVPLLVVSAQLALGRGVMWLPASLARRDLPRERLIAVADRLLPWINRAERVLKPRLGFMLAPVGDRLIGLVCTLLSAVLFLPIPFGSVPPALALVAFALALLARDGVAALVGWTVAGLSFALLIVVFQALRATASVFLDSFLSAFGLS